MPRGSPVEPEVSLIAPISGASQVSRAGGAARDHPVRRPRRASRVGDQRKAATPSRSSAAGRSGVGSRSRRAPAPVRGGAAPGSRRGRPARSAPRAPPAAPAPSSSLGEPAGELRRRRGRARRALHGASGEGDERPRPGATRRARRRRRGSDRAAARAHRGGTTSILSAASRRPRAAIRREPRNRPCPPRTSRLRLRRHRRRPGRLRGGDRARRARPPRRALRARPLPPLPHRRVAAGDRQRARSPSSGSPSGCAPPASREVGRAARSPTTARLGRTVDFAASPEVAAPADLAGLPREVRRACCSSARARSGVEVREGHRVAAIDFDADGADVDCAAPTAAPASERASRAVVDASGRGGLLARKFDLRRDEPRLANVAIYAHYSGVPRLAGRARRRHPHRRPPRRRLVLADPDRRAS